MAKSPAAAEIPAPAAEDAEVRGTMALLRTALTHPDMLTRAAQFSTIGLFVIAIVWCAFVAKPALLLADEPTGNLDGTTGHSIVDLMFDLKERHGTALLLITHDPKLAARCGRAARMLDGKLSPAPAILSAAQ